MTWRQRALAAEKEVKRLREIEHAAWHLLENSEERPGENCAVADWDDYLKLSALLPEEHPQ